MDAVLGLVVGLHAQELADCRHKLGLTLCLLLHRDTETVVEVGHADALELLDHDVGEGRRSSVEVEHRRSQAKRVPRHEEMSDAPRVGVAHGYDRCGPVGREHRKLTKRALLVYNPSSKLVRALGCEGPDDSDDVIGRRDPQLFGHPREAVAMGPRVRPIVNWSHFLSLLYREARHRHPMGRAEGLADLILLVDHSLACRETLANVEERCLPALPERAAPCRCWRSRKNAFGVLLLIRCRFAQVGVRLSREEVPPSVVRMVRQGRMTDPAKPDGRVRGIVASDVIRRLVARTMAPALFGNSSQLKNCAGRG